MKINHISLLAFLGTVVASSSALLTNPITNTNTNTNTKTNTFKTLKDRAYVTKDIKTPDPIPEEGHEAALELMKSGRLYRYNIAAGEESVVSMCEQDVIDYTGHKYCVALNSCGSAIMLMLKTTGLKPGDKVLSNAFTFGAVPSAIEHAGGKAVYVETTMDMLIDTDDLEKKLKANPDCKHVLISHMRGKVGDMATIKALCDKHDAVLLEDCAHSLGVRYCDKHSGHMGKVAAISSQSYKMINSGEGGFLITNDPDVAAQTAVYAGAYEALSSKHVTVPSKEYFKDYPTTLPNYSLRMSNLHAAVIRPQLKTLDERIAKYNSRYTKLAAFIQERLGDLVHIPVLDAGVTQMVHDSFQFNLHDSFTPAMVQEFLSECNDHGLYVENFGHKTNARNFVNWGFAPHDTPLPKTAKMLARACDVRMPLMWDDEDFQDMANVIVESVEKVLSEHGLL
jgi:dTDP-4-amino-4,6-dideoxygalactose transaminase